MNEATIYRDDFSQVFGQESTFLGFLRERETNAEWNTEASSTLRFEALEEDATVTQLLLDNYAMGGREGILKDTMENTRLLLKASERYYPVRSCAVKTILDRARVSGSALSKVKKPVLAQILNECMKVASGDALLRIADDKVSAVLGGDSSDYSILEMPALFGETMTYLQKRFSGYTFAGGWFDHSIVTALWELTSTPELVESYERALVQHGKKPEELKPALRLTSSDVGLSGANLFPTLFKGRDSKILTLGNPLKLEHTNGASLDKFCDQLEMIFSQYTKAMKNLTALLDVEIMYPVNTMLGIMKRISVPKKLAYQAADLFKGQYGEDGCTAHEVYYGISEVLFLLQCDGAEGSRIAQMEEKVARALHIRWHDYDMPGEFVW